MSAASQARHEAILAAAKAAFLEGGYQLASMDRIAERAQTTKRTVYDHFGSKDALFSAVIAAACRNVVAALPEPGSLPKDPREGLAQFAREVADVIGTVGCIRLQRLVISESERHPHFAGMLYDTALMGAENVLADYLERCVADDWLKPHDCRASARLLIDVMVHGASLRKLFAVAEREEEQDASNEKADHMIDMLIAAYRPH
ncbi:TetR/AcrR family transcriptional regulator [Bosea caraganae]|nr:TetR/AcrR family transcriptional regulator [Bosea caraganae]